MKFNFSSDGNGIENWTKFQSEFGRQTTEFQLGQKLKPISAKAENETHENLIIKSKFPSKLNNSVKIGPKKLSKKLTNNSEI